MSTIELLRKAGRVLRAQGPLALARAARQYAVPPRASCWPAVAGALEHQRIIEVGGPSSVFSKRGILPLYPIVETVDNCTFASSTLWVEQASEGKTYQYHSNRPPGQQFFGEAGALSSTVSGRYAGLVSSHVIEHIANPIAALLDWKQVLEDEGTLLLIVPHKDGTFDHRRPTTALGHMIDDYEREVTEDDLTHLDEILALHDFDRDPGAASMESFEKRARDNGRFRGLHHHVFDARLVAQLLDHCNYQIQALEALAPLHIVALARLPAPGERADNSLFLRGDAPGVKDSPFPSDRAIAASDPSGGLDSLR